VGWTPLYDCPSIAEEYGIGEFHVKDDGRNPTGSLKDRASAVGVARAVELNQPVIACASTGNAASSLAGFAAETDDVEENALGKLRRKNLDFIAANDVSKPGCGFAADTNSITVYAADGRCFHLPFGLKTEVAKQILNIITGDTE